MGKGGYGKAWSRGSTWQNQQRWNHGKGERQRWEHQEWRNQPSHSSHSSFNQLCSGVVSSAWEGVCSGVASAAWKAVEGAGTILLKSRESDNKASASNAAQSMMDCLVGKAEAPDQAQPANAISPDEASALNQSSAEKMVLTVLELQKEQLQQQSMLQKQLLEMCVAKSTVAESPGKPAKGAKPETPSPPTTSKSVRASQTRRSKLNKPKIPVKPAKPALPAKPGKKKATGKGKREWLASLCGQVLDINRFVLQWCFWRLCTVAVLLSICWGMLRLNLYLAQACLQEWEAAQALNLAKEALTEATAAAEVNSERARSFHPGKSFSAAVFPSLQELLGGFPHLDSVNLMLQMWPLARQSLLALTI